MFFLCSSLSRSLSVCLFNLSLWALLTQKCRICNLQFFYSIFGCKNIVWNDFLLRFILKLPLITLDYYAYGFAHTSTLRLSSSHFHSVFETRWIAWILGCVGMLSSSATYPFSFIHSHHWPCFVELWVIIMYMCTHSHGIER